MERQRTSSDAYRDARNELRSITDHLSDLFDFMVEYRDANDREYKCMDSYAKELEDIIDAYERFVDHHGLTKEFDEFRANYAHDKALVREAC